MARTVSIRQSLLTSIVVIITALGVAILTTTFIGARRAARTLSSALIDRALAEMTAELDGYFEPVVDDLLLLRAWGEAGLLDDFDPHRLNQLLQPIIVGHPQVSSVIVGDETGREHMLLRTPDQWRSRQTHPDEWGPVGRMLTWTSDAVATIASTEELDYDTRRRPWFRAANATENPGDVAWTEPYVFFTTRDLGITVSTRFRRPDGTVSVLGFDILLSAITDFTERLRPSPGGLAFILTEERLFIGLPAGDLWESADRRHEALLSAPRDVGIRLLVDAADAIEGHERGVAIRFKSAGERWWGESRRYPLTDGQQLAIAVLVPEDDLIGSLLVLRVLIVFATVAAVIAAILRAVVLAGRYSRPVEALVRQSDRISRGDLEPGPPIDSRVTEVHELAAAHERMREGLGTLLKMERDLQLARQIQQGTFPDELPTLDGFEIEAWSDPADETGGDTFDVIGYARTETGLRLSTGRVERAVLLVADATGHGIGPALSATQVRSMLRISLRLAADLPTLTRHLNEELCADLPPGRFVTAWLGRIDAEAKTIDSVSFGQAPLLRYDAAADEFETRAADAVPLGIDPDLEPVAPTTTKMEPGDIFAAISDGIFEATDPNDELFGTDRVKKVVRDNRGRHPREILAALRDAVDAFTEGAPAKDDRTVILVKRRS